VYVNERRLFVGVWRGWERIILTAKSNAVKTAESKKFCGVGERAACVLQTWRKGRVRSFNHEVGTAYGLDGQPRKTRKTRTGAVYVNERRLFVGVWRGWGRIILTAKSNAVKTA
jgi:hypothetical protein